jgi:hypothetical protein
MHELPSDPPRLRAILAHLDEQLAGNETVGIYLRLQRDTVRAALAAAERRGASESRRLSAPRHTAPPPAADPDSAPDSGSSPTGYVIEPKQHPGHPMPALYHLARCAMPRRSTSPITPEQIRIGLRDPLGYLAPCEFCAPDNTLDPDS